MFERTFRIKRTNQQWNCLYLENPAGKYHIAVAVDSKENLIGHVSSIPIFVKYDDQRVIFGQGVDFMIRSDYRGIKNGNYLFLDLVGFFCDRFLRPDKEVIQYGIPNLIAFKTIVKEANLISQHSPLVYLTRSLNNKTSSLNECQLELKSNNLKIELLTSFDENSDLIWQKRQKDYRVIPIKNQRYLQWRYQKRDIQKYLKYIVYLEQKPIGIIVLGELFFKNQRCGAVIDWIIPHEYIEYFQDIILFSEKVAMFYGVNKLVFLFPEYSLEHQYLLENGYQPENSGYNLCMSKPKNFDNEIWQNSCGSWFYTLGDFDII